MFNYFKKLLQSSKISSSKQTIKTRAFEIVEKMEKLSDHLEIIKDNNFKDSKDIYEKNKNIIINLYTYYCKFAKLYIDLAFSQILIPVDKITIRNMDIKNFINELKKYYKNDYEITVINFKEEDKHSIENLYIGLIKDIDELANLLLKIQLNIIINEISPINESSVIEKMINNLNYEIITENYINIEDNYKKYLDELNASKEVFD